MATLKITACGVSASGTVSQSGTLYHATAQCTVTLTVTYSTASSNENYTVTSSKLSATINTTSSGDIQARSVAIKNARTIALNQISSKNKTYSFKFNGVVVASKTGSSIVNASDMGNIAFSGSKSISKTHATQSPSIQFTDGSTTASTNVSVPARPSYTISYAANGGSSTPTSQTKWYNENITLANAISRTGYTFSAWKWSGNNTTYPAGISWNVANASGTMTAQWNANTYQIKYNANSGTGSMSNSSHTYDTAKTLTYNTFTRTHYLFKGWATSSTGSVVYTNGQSVKNLTSTNGATINLYAVWEYKYSKPSITGLTAYRTTHEVDPSSETRHKKDDAGNYADIEVAVNVGQEKSIAGGTFSPTNTTVEFFYKPYNDPQQPNFINLNLSQQISANDSVIVNTINSNLNLILSTEQQYEILVKAYVTATGINGPDLATRETFISTAYFLVDMTENAIAFGQAVTDPNCFTCNMDEKLIGRLLLNTQAEDGKLFMVGVTDPENVDVGWNYEDGHGAGVGFRSANHGSPGQFAIYARSGPTSAQTSTLIGTPAGALTWNGTSIVQTSDRRLKKHQSYLSTEAIEFVQKLNPTLYKKNDTNQVGFYAQDIEQIDPWNCLVGESEGYKTLNYIGIIAPLVTYCQYLEERIDKLEAKLKE